MSGKRPTDHLEPAAKKRGSDRQLTKDNHEDEEDEAVDTGEFQRANEETLKQRRIVRTRRAPAPAGPNPFASIQLAPSAPSTSPNPFAGVSLLAPAAFTAEAAVPKEAGQQAQSGVKDDTGAPSTTVDGADVASAQEVASKQGKDDDQAVEPAKDEPAATVSVPTPVGFGAFTGTIGGGLAFGSGGAGGGGFGGFGSLASSAAASAFGESSMPSFGAAPSAAAPSVFGAALPTTRPDLPAQLAVSTGEEEDRTVFSVDGVLFEWDAEKRWRERGRGEVRVNVDQRSGHARVVMRQKGNLRLLLNGRLWPQMQITRLEGGGGVSFAVVNHLEATGAEGGEGPTMAPYALRIKPADALERFIAVVEEHKASGSQE